MSMIDRAYQLAFVLARVLLASLFILGGVNKILNYSETLAMMQAANMPITGLLLPATILLELGGGLVVALGRFRHGVVALALACYTLLVNLVFHAFWALPEPESAMQLSLFFKNISIVGGLLLVAAIARSRRDFT